MAKTKKTAKAAKKSTVKVKPKSKKAKTAKPKKAVKRPAAKKTAKKAAPKKVAPKKAVAKKAPAKASVKKSTTIKKATKTVKAAEKMAVPSLTFFPPITQRPIAHKQVQKDTGTDSKTRYSEGELKEFETLILGKLEKSRNEYKILKETLNRNNDEGTDATSGGNTKVLEDGAETAEKENLSQLAARQQKYITNLENALVRIKNGTYGICSVTGKLIPKDRLIAVPHTTQSIEAKMMKKD